MRYAYAVTQAETISAVVRDAQPLIAALTAYSQWLETLGAVDEPRGIVFHDLASATTVFSTLVLPAWTDLTLIHLDPVLDDWKQIFLSALASGMPGATQVLVEDYYQTLETVDVATIAAHELTHHLHCFSDTPQQATWFEEGFCFYAPRKQLLSPARLSHLQQVERPLLRRMRHVWEDIPFGSLASGKREGNLRMPYLITGGRFIRYHTSAKPMRVVM